MGLWKNVTLSVSDAAKDSCQSEMNLSGNEAVGMVAEPPGKVNRTEIRKTMAQVNERILRGYDGTVTNGAFEWIGSLGDSYLEALARERAQLERKARKEEMFKESLVETVNMVWSLVHDYAMRFGHAVGGSVSVSATMPGFVTEIARQSRRYLSAEFITSYRARLSTGSWSLVLRGQSDKIEFFLIPADEAIGLSKAETRFQPLCTLTAAEKGKSIKWCLNGREMKEEGLRQLTRDLFSRLIMQTVDQEDENDGQAVA